MAVKSIFETICDTLNSDEKLKEEKVITYPPATKKGECKEPYVVLKQDGGSKIGSFSSERVYYRFMIYVPRSMYSNLEYYESIVKNVIDTKLYPMLMPTGQKETDYYDDNLNAHLRTFLYSNNVRNKHL